MKIASLQILVLYLSFASTNMGCAPRLLETSSSVKEDQVPIHPIDDKDQVAKNAKISEEFLRIDTTSPSKVEFLDAKARDLLLLDAKAHPVARLDQLNKYDPQKLTGFCFGRAMAVHILARQRGLKPQSIKKQFIVGDLRGIRAKETEWRFHLTTLVKGEGGKWYAIDPIFPRVLTQTEWIEKTRAMWDEWYKESLKFKDPQSRIYIVSRDGVMPDIRSFVPPERETAEHIIELSFAPNSQIGFTRESSLGERVYSLNDRATEKFFLTTSELPKENRFNFIGLGFNDGFFIDYNNYFQNLIFGIPDIGPAIGVRAFDQENRDGDQLKILSKSISFDFNKILKLKSKNSKLH
jgi:hypothetical protein